MKNPIKALSLFVLALILAFGSTTWFVSKLLTTEYETQQKNIDKDEWNLLRNSLNLYLSQAKKQGQDKVAYVTLAVNEYYDYDQEAIANALDAYQEPKNPIRIIITEAVNDLYFNNIKSDNTDGFVVYDFMVSEDLSENCVSFGSTRSFDLEMLMHGNPELALEAFTRIAIGDVDNYETGAIDNPIFFQFDTHPDGVNMQSTLTNIPTEHQGKLGLELTSYDMAGLEAYFMDTKSWESTFRAFEFVTPAYVLLHADLADRPYIESGIRTDIPKLSLNVVFNYKNVIDHNAILKSDLKQFEERREQLKTSYIIKERMLYLTIILLIVICFITMHYTNKQMEITATK